MRRSKKFWDRIFLGFFVFWLFIIEIMCLLLLEPNYMVFITTIGIFFIPLISSIGVILGLLYTFIFKFPTIKDVKNRLADVYKRGNIIKEDFDKIAEGLEIALKRQDDYEHTEELKELEKKREIVSEKSKIESEKLSIIKDIAIAKENKSEGRYYKKTEVEKSLESY